MYISLVLDRIIIQILYLLHLMEQFTRTFFFTKVNITFQQEITLFHVQFITDILKIRNDITLVPT